MMLKLGEITDFTVVSFSPAAIRGGVFGMRSGRWKLLRSASRAVANVKKSSAQWRELWRELRGGGDLVVLAGNVPGGVFFTFDATPLPAREQRDALMMELPRQLLKTPDDPALQFLPAGAAADDRTALNVYCVERKALDTVLEPLRGAKIRADELVHPLLMTKPDDPAVFLPELDSGFYFLKRRFHRVAEDDGCAAAASRWRETMAAHFDCEADDAQFRELLPVFLVARSVITGEFRRHRKELALLPKEMRPVRFRGQLRLTALLAAALIGVAAWRFVVGRWRDFQEYRGIAAETGRIKADTAKMQKFLAASKKEQKDIDKVLNSVAEDCDVLKNLAEISKLLPQDVMAADFRWNEGEISFTLLSENENLDLPGILRPLRKWQIADIQHRNSRQNPITTISVKLVRADKTSAKTGKNAKNAKGARGRRK